MKVVKNILKTISFIKDLENKISEKYPLKILLAIGIILILLQLNMIKTEMSSIGWEVSSIQSDVSSIQNELLYR